MLGSGPLAPSPFPLRPLGLGEGREISLTGYFRILPREVFFHETIRTVISMRHQVPLFRELFRKPTLRLYPHYLLSPYRLSPYSAVGAMSRFITLGATLPAVLMPPAVVYPTQGGLSGTLLTAIGVPGSLMLCAHSPSILPWPRNLSPVSRDG